MSEDPSFDADTDPESAMRQMMGFASFSTRRPREQPKVAFPVESRSLTAQSHQPQSNSTSTSAATEHHNALGSANSDSDTARPLPVTVLETVSNDSIPPTPLQPREQLAYMFTNPATNRFYTRTDLNDWAQGKVNARGDMVYFKPAFISDDPWARLRPKENGQANRGRASAGIVS
ncbi:hypothetical protein A1O3_03750 [Capronia epimyces CBS 606.96]|uniref:Uncharacterized protein n=1 Tax=Capronia epimyces CBS 606.96 TaxID=1182542 RepID=W9YC06_9EURO|nr:uncharacterized protein A1O3_03750 [Capronia epimyces CBS 606.96]EXJ86796.1 hypothetical protein A1O3_03750 [Capronia epimyces CBS 606.96]